MANIHRPPRFGGAFLFCHPVVNSRDVAKRFEKRHVHVLADIGKMWRIVKGHGIRDISLFTPFPCNRPRDRLPRSARGTRDATAGHCSRAAWQVVPSAQQAERVQR
jgi:hypothetical protein